MCYTLYIASDKIMPLIHWNEDNPTFYVSELIESDKTITKQFNKINIYYAGSHEGCGCGFCFDDTQIDDEEDKEENDKSRETVKKLVDYLKTALENDATLELFFCWDGDQAESPNYYIELEPDDLLGETFPLEARTLVKIKQKVS